MIILKVHYFFYRFLDAMAEQGEKKELEALEEQDDEQYGPENDEYLNNNSL